MLDTIGRHVISLLLFALVFLLHSNAMIMADVSPYPSEEDAGYYTLTYPTSLSISKFYFGTSNDALSLSVILNVHHFFDYVLNKHIRNEVLRAYLFYSFRNHSCSGYVQIDKEPDNLYKTVIPCNLRNLVEDDLEFSVVVIDKFHNIFAELPTYDNDGIFRSIFENNEIYRKEEMLADTYDEPTFTSYGIYARHGSKVSLYIDCILSGCTSNQIALEIFSGDIFDPSSYPLRYGYKFFVSNNGGCGNDDTRVNIDTGGLVARRRGDGGISLGSNNTNKNVYIMCRCYGNKLICDLERHMFWPPFISGIMGAVFHRAYDNDITSDTKFITAIFQHHKCKIQNGRVIKCFRIYD